MYYREAGQFKTTYAADSRIFTIRQDRTGMLALCLSSFTPTSRFGFLMASQMVASLLGEMVFLPALLCIVQPGCKRSKTNRLSLDDTAPALPRASALRTFVPTRTSSW